MPLDERPDAGYIASIESQLQEQWAAAHAKFKDIDTYIQNTYDVWPQELQKARASWRPSRGPAILNHAVDNQLGYNPRAKVIPAGTGSKALADADLGERFLHAVFFDASMREATLPFKAAGRYLEAYGYVVVEGPLLDFEEEPEEPQREKGENEEDFRVRRRIHRQTLRNWNPFRIKVPHPARVLLPPMEKQPSVAIKRSMRYAVELERLTAQKEDSKRPYAQAWVRAQGMLPLTQVEVVEYWATQWHAMMVSGGDLLFVERNLWGFVPYTHAYEGSGMEPTSYQNIDPSHYCVGIYEHTRDMLRADAQRMSAHHELLLQSAYAPLGTTKSPEEMAQQLAKGEIVQGEKGDLWIMDTVQVNQWMFQHGEDILKDIEAGTFISALAGAKQPGVSTVGQQAILSTAAAKRFVAPQMQLEHLASIVGSRILRLVDQMGRKLTVRGQTLGPENVRGNYTVEVTFPMIDEVMQMQRRQQGMNEVAAGLKSSETYRANDLLLEDETGEVKRMAKDMVRRHPAVIAEMAKAVAEEMGVGDIIRRFEEEQAAQVQRPQGEQFAEPRGNGSQPLRQPLTPSTVKPAPRRGL